MPEYAPEHYIARLNNHIKLTLGQLSIPAPLIQEAIEYSLFVGGKRVRPLLCYYCAECLNVSPEIADIAATAIELVHCYSLIHDDLPAMDNDDYRRGRLSCHRAFNEATAILAGDAMQALAFEVILTDLPKYLPATTIIDVAKQLAISCGPEGMISGQSLDLTELEQKNLSEERLCFIHQLKTGRLIATCISMMMTVSNVTEQDKKYLTDYSSYLGLVFQMQDDFLDTWGENDCLGKKRNSDAANDKFTYSRLYTKDDLLDTINQYYQKANDALDALSNPAHGLKSLTNELQQRTLGIKCPG